jgi:hypothetical protein
MSVLLNGSSSRVNLALGLSNWPTLCTIIAWVKPTSAMGNGGRATVLVGYGSGSGLLHGLSIRSTGTTGAPCYETFFAGDLARWMGDDDIMVADAWQGIAVTMDATSDTNDPALYHKPEGGAISALTVTQTLAASGTLNSAIDELWAGGVGAGSYLFAGKLAYVRLFVGVILDQTEIDAELDALAAIASAEIDVAFGADADDASGNGHDGTLLGSAALDGDNPTLAGGGGGGVPLLLLLGASKDDLRQKDALDQSFEVFFRDTTTGEGATGLVAADMDIRYYRHGAAAVALTESDLAAIGTAHTDGGVKEIGLGFYRVDAPDAALATGVDRVKLFGVATGAIMEPLSVALVDYDPIAEGADVSGIATDVDAIGVLATAIASDTNDIQARLPAALVGGKIDASVGAVAADAITASGIAADAGTEIAAAVGALVVEGTTTVVQSLRLHNAALGGKSTNSGKTYRDLADSKDRIAATVDGSKNRTAVTRDLT